MAHQQALLQNDMCARQAKLHTSSNQHSSNLSKIGLSQSAEPFTMAQQRLVEEPRMIASSTVPANDGYNWRKYGQKQVKGSENPRSYYKCTFPNCLVKRKVERSLDGQITEIVYKGEHNHPKPDHAKRSSFGVQGQELSTVETDQDHNICEKNEGIDRLVENENAARFSEQSMLHENHAPLDPVDMETDSAYVGTAEDFGRGCDEVAKGLRADHDGNKRKRRKRYNRNNEAGSSGKGGQDPHVLLHNITEPEIMGDGFRWRKYGQKVVKGNPYPRIKPSPKYYVLIIVT
ncbi:WRKY transcription factor SUSIBA2 [Bienertia sinuspersici]